MVIYRKNQDEELKMQRRTDDYIYDNTNIPFRLLLHNEHYDVVMCEGETHPFE